MCPPRHPYLFILAKNEEIKKMVAWKKYEYIRYRSYIIVVLCQNYEKLCSVLEIKEIKRQSCHCFHKTNMNNVSVILE